VSLIQKIPLWRMRPMERRDLERVMEVERACYPYPWTQGNFEDCLRVGHVCEVSVQGSNAIGHYVLSTGAGEAHLLNLCVHPRQWRKGLGRAMLRHAVQQAKNREADTLFLEVRASNQGAQALYQAQGFNEIGRRRGYYPADGGKEDALIFAMALL
jgi:ribosomal-protein-alanine N-acetyltransferase